MLFKKEGVLAKWLRRGEVAPKTDGIEPMEESQVEPPKVQAPKVEAVRIKRADANNLLHQLEQDLTHLIENQALLAEQYAAAKQEGNQLKTEIIARSFMGVEQSIVLKKNLYGELAELEQMLGWDENRSAFDYISQSFSIDLDQSQKEFSERIASHAVRRRKQFDLAHIVKEGEAALGRMRDTELDEALQALDKLASKKMAVPDAIGVLVESKDAGPTNPLAHIENTESAEKSETPFPVLQDPQFLESPAPNEITPATQGSLPESYWGSLPNDGENAADALGYGETGSESEQGAAGAKVLPFPNQRPPKTD